MRVIANIITCFLFSKLVTAQLNGEFWWLNEKLGKHAKERTPPKFEELTEFDTDESAKIVFRDNDLLRTSVSVKLEKSAIKEVPGDSKIYFRDHSSIAWPTNYNQEPLNTKPNVANKLIDDRHTKPTQYKNTIRGNDEDIFDFKFPIDANFIWKDEERNYSSILPTENPKDNKGENTTYKVVLINSKVPIKVLSDFTPETENICSYLKKSDCNKKGGVVYIKRGAKKFVFDSALVCCILPFTNNNTNKISFLDNPTNVKRYKRSNRDTNTNPALAQRHALLLRKYSPGLQVEKTRLPPVIQTILAHKIAAPGDDDVDPYWNIKNSDFKKGNTKLSTIQQTQNKHDFVSEEYVEDYTVELPKPGLVGLYSDHSGSPGWTFGNGNKQPAYGGGGDSTDDVGEEQPSFGYGASIDPRLKDRLIALTSRPPFLLRPGKVTTQTTSDEYVFDIESQTISYQSNPDFQVLQGFKLLHNKSKIHTIGKKTTVVGNDSKESVLVNSGDDTDYDVFDTNQQVYKECGKPFIKDGSDKEKNIGDTENGSHPWLALVVLTRRRQTILCYATLVHSRAAVTSADCVHGRACPGEVTLIAGAWDLNDEVQEGWQKRLISVYIHEEYSPGELANNLAVLHWSRPLKLKLNVQPACLTDPHVGDDCKFYGWGGYDQAIRTHSRWQRASILTPRLCNDRLSSKKESIPSDAFCASVHSRGTVTGIGAPLVCNIAGRHAAAGVAIWRDNVVLLAPVHDWTMRVLHDLHLN